MFELLEVNWKITRWTVDQVHIPICAIILSTVMFFYTCTRRTLYYFAQSLSSKQGSNQNLFTGAGQASAKGGKNIVKIFRCIKYKLKIFLKFFSIKPIKINSTIFK